MSTQINTDSSEEVEEHLRFVIQDQFSLKVYRTPFLQATGKVIEVCTLPFVQYA